MSTVAIGFAANANAATKPNWRIIKTALERAVPDRFKRHAHHWLILHGRYVCKARRPDCPNCVIADLCRYPDKTA
jgi:endonuclease-3